VRRKKNIIVSGDVIRLLLLRSEGSFDETPPKGKGRKALEKESYHWDQPFYQAEGALSLLSKKSWGRSSVKNSLPNPFQGASGGKGPPGMKKGWPCAS